MAQYCYRPIQIAVNTPLPDDAKIMTMTSPQNLSKHGFNMQVQIANASSLQKVEGIAPVQPITVMAHFDTGANCTCIELALAQTLGLISTGEMQQRTASGICTSPTFAIDLSFPGTRLSQFVDLRIGSCNIGFDHKKHEKNPNDPQNMGLLIGRDIMSRWNIVWNGPTSTVIISD